eukprot:TRINITY_DN10286_c0_g1_i1.p1 TRINITY_DN10286_c0_g1~~TRINITY_DN10286_c0_g1_i1.p1  ORF type:complete len:256 (-),score=67.25 TRINITY_DN10286_c0_g1_i1:33-800(-)
MAGCTNVLLSLLVVLISHHVKAQDSFVPTAGCLPATITFYGYNGGGACEFGTVNSSTLEYPFTTALSQYDFNNSMACGECYLLGGPRGTVVVMVVDLCPSGGNSICSTEKYHFDLADEEIFAMLDDPSKGVSSVNSTRVSCPLTGNVGVLTDSGISPYWFGLVVYNHIVSITSVDIQPTTESEWTQMIRQPYNYWLYTNGVAIQTPFNIRITSEFGDQITTSISDLTSDKLWPTNYQFPVPSSRLYPDVCTPELA